MIGLSASLMEDLRPEIKSFITYWHHYHINPKYHFAHGVFSYIYYKYIEL